MTVTPYVGLLPIFRLEQRGDYSGIGADFKTWTAIARASAPF